MKAKEVIDNLRTMFINTGSKLGEELRDQHLMFLIDSARSIIAERSVMSKSKTLDSMLQSISIKPNRTNKSEVGFIGDSYPYRLDLPDRIDTSIFTNGIFYMGDSQGETVVTPSSFKSINMSIRRKYTGSGPMYFMLNDSVYIAQLPMELQKSVKVRALFETPSDIAKMDPNYNPIFPYDFKYPFPQKELSMLYQVAMSGELGFGDEAVSAINQRRAKQNKDSEIVNALKGLTNAQVQQEPGNS